MVKESETTSSLDDLIKVAKTKGSELEQINFIEGAIKLRKFMFSNDLKVTNNLRKTKKRKEIEIKNALEIKNARVDKEGNSYITILYEE